MEREEIVKELSLTYNDLATYLQVKYGMSKYDYFHTPSCKSVNKKVSRTKEGLMCHHIDENVGYNLSEPSCAIQQPYVYQKKERLVYCNILEHLILHLKICSMDKDLRVNIGATILANKINTILLTDNTENRWEFRCLERIKDNYYEYIDVLKAFLAFLSTHLNDSVDSNDRTRRTQIIRIYKHAFSKNDLDSINIIERVYTDLSYYTETESIIMSRCFEKDYQEIK
ncbi:MAG: hypothetical protein IJU52_06635 [Clostridia bacterium]|nr:hypothetical protein [Clostridia bacterium]